MSILEVRNLKKSFGKVNVLKGIDFSLEKGEVLAIIGSSGGGKTTLLRCLNFLEYADEGTISVGGEVIYVITKPKSERTVFTSVWCFSLSIYFHSTTYCVM